MDFLTLERFKKVAELEHLTEAAKQLHIAQPALSRTISKLEAELGVPLFDRSNRQIALNDYGRIVLRHTGIIFDELASMQNEIKDQRGRKSHNVNISLYAASKTIPDLIKEFNRKYPNIVLKIKQENLDGALENVDIIIDSSANPSTSDNGVVLLEEEILLALPANHPISQKKQIQLWEVSQLDFICLPKGKGLRKITDEYCRLAGFTPNVILECDSPEMTRELISVGIGAAFIPEVTWNLGESDNVVLKTISGPVCKRYINLIYQKSSYITTASILFRDFTKSYFQKLSKEIQFTQSRCKNKSLPEDK